MKTSSNPKSFRYTVIALFILLVSFQQTKAQDYLNINLSGGGNFYSLLSEMQDITFDGTGNATFTKTDASFVTVALNTITDLTYDAAPGGGSPLPVELVSFSANVADTAVVLSWVTATEVNNYGFDVERQDTSTSLSASWETLGFVQGHGTANSPKNYEFTDFELPNSGEVNYRLKQIDNDGTFAYSKIVTIDLTTITGVADDEIPIVYSLSQNYPNPFNPTTKIKFGLPESGFVKLNVYNILGQEVASLVNKEMTAGYHEVSFGTSNLSSGLYIYRISVGNKFSAIKKMLMVK